MHPIFARPARPADVRPDARHSATTGPVTPDTAHESTPAPPTPQRASDGLDTDPPPGWTPRPKATYTERDTWREELVLGDLAYLTDKLGSPQAAAKARFTRKDT